MLFCPSFTQSKRFLHTGQVISRLRRVEYTAMRKSRDELHSRVLGKRDRDQVRCSDLVGSDLPHSLIDVRQMLHLSKSQGSAMSRLRSHNFCEAVCNLLTVTMYLQDALLRLHCPSLHEVDLRIHVASTSTCTLAFHEA